MQGFSKQTEWTPEMNALDNATIILSSVCKYSSFLDCPIKNSMGRETCPLSGKDLIGRCEEATPEIWKDYLSKIEKSL